MITSQEIREKNFERVVFNGIDAADVDDFLDLVASDFALVQKENTTLRGKMRVLAKTIEEYRSNEEALRMALISAQKLSAMIEREARDKSDGMVSDAVTEAARVTKEARLMVEIEDARLMQAQRASAQFIESMNILYHKQLDYLEKLSQTKILKTAIEQAEKSKSAAAPFAPIDEEDAPTEMHETVKSIEETVAKAANEPAVNIRPEIESAVASPEMEDEAPTRQFSVTLNTGAAPEGTSEFLFDGFGEK